MTDIPARLTASLADRYVIERELGAGGMATVYLAHDVRHDRRVALKVLRPELAATLGPDRFPREIRIVAKLQHPHVLPLHDSGETAGFLYYVMPYVDGESLRQKLERDGPMPVHDAVRVLREVVDALAYAHSHGVLHRDIKPDNVMLSGRHALVTDFGVARAVSEATGRSTITTMGVALGTPAYMAPEQASADPHVDHRADIYALGVVAYELLAGRVPFTGATPQQVLASHVTETPDPVSRHRPGVSEDLERVVMRCLAKRPADRWQNAGELLAALEPLATPSGGTQPTAARLPAVVVGRSGMWAAAVGLVLFAAVGAWLLLRATGPSWGLGKSTQVTSEQGLEIHPAISPDGKLVAYAAGSSQRMRIFIRPVAGGRTIPLSDDSTAMETHPRWSPDGSRLLYLTRGGVSIAPALGGSATATIPPSPTSVVVTAAWSPDGEEIAFVRGDSLLARRVTGGVTRLVAVAPELTSCAWSGDSRWIACVKGNWLYLQPGPTFGNLAPSQVVLVPASGGVPTALSEETTKLHQSPVWSPEGRTLLFVSNRDGPRDIYVAALGRDGRLRGPVSRLTTGLNAHSVSISADGRQLAYAVYTAQANVWSLPIPKDGPVSIDRAVPVTSGSQIIEATNVSRDGKWLTYDSDLRGNADIYRIPLVGGRAELLAAEPFDEFTGDLSPDGRFVAYHSWRGGTRDIEVKPLDGGPAVRVTDTPAQESYPVWSPDGRALAFFDQAKPYGIFVVRQDASGRWGGVVRRATGAMPAWFPDGRRLAFIARDSTAGAGLGSVGTVMTVSVDSGRAALVYAPSPSSPVPERPLVSADGREIYFKSHDAEGRAALWSVPAAGGTPRLLVRFTDPNRPSNRGDFSHDGTRFFFAVDDRQSDIWVAEITRK